MDGNNDKISQLQKRIDDLKQIANADIGASFKEAVQTTEMIKMLEIQIHDLKESLRQQKDAITIKLISVDNKEEIVVKIVSSTPDPSNYIFSSASPIGQQLVSSKAGDKINIRGQLYEVV